MVCTNFCPKRSILLIKFRIIFPKAIKKNSIFSLGHQVFFPESKTGFVFKTLKLVFSLDADFPLMIMMMMMNCFCGVVMMNCFCELLLFFRYYFSREFMFEPVLKLDQVSNLTKFTRN